MADMSTHWDKQLDEMDASVFSSDMMFDPDRYPQFKIHVERWSRAIAEHEGAAALTREQEAQPAEDARWVAEAKETLDRLSRFLQHIGAPHAVDWREWIDNAEKHLAAQPAAQGWQLVPVMPTEDMEIAVEKAETRHRIEDKRRGGHDPELSFRVAYQAALAAAPKAQPAAQEQSIPIGRILRLASDLSVSKKPEDSFATVAAFLREVAAQHFNLTKETK